MTSNFLRLAGYANTEGDTAPDTLEFVGWKMACAAASHAIVGDSYLRRSLEKEDDDGALFCAGRFLGTDCLLSVYPFCSFLSQDDKWNCSVRFRSHSQVVDSAGTCDEAIDKLIAYARDVMLDESAVIEQLNDTDREFVRQAKAAGATVKLENNRSERNKGVEIVIGNDLSTGEHPFRQGFRLIAYARPEGCHWGCWYYFDGLDTPGSRQRGIDVDARKGFSVARIVEAAGTCDGCGKRIPIDEIRTVSFAGGSCKGCEPQLKERLQPAGWCS